MPFQFRIFLRIHALLWKSQRNPRARLRTIRSALRTLVRVSRHRLGFLIDDLIFREYREIEIRSPVFIVGAARSGSTFFHRLLAEDKETFTCTRLWEINRAPSITEKYLFLVLKNVSRRISRIRFIPRPASKSHLDQRINAIHQTGPDLPEEDEYLFATLYASPVLVQRVPVLPRELELFWRFDECLSEEVRAALMAYYRRCIQAHVYVFGRGRTYLAKAPDFTTKLRSLRATFPDARFVQLVRDPREAVSSSLSKVTKRGGSKLLKQFAEMTPEELDSFRNQALEHIRYLYLYPLQLRDEWGCNAHSLIMYHDLISDPEATVRGLYREFDMMLPRSFEPELARQTVQARKFRSPHRHGLEDSGIEEDAFREFFSEVYSRFDFPAENVSPVGD